jgi:hypothetical protein
LVRETQAAPDFAKRLTLLTEPNDFGQQGSRGMHQVLFLAERPLNGVNLAVVKFPPQHFRDGNWLRVEALLSAGVPLADRSSVDVTSM